MISADIVIKNELGLHMRPAGVLARAAAGCESVITLENGGRKVNPKSVLLLMSACVKRGDTITVTCEGQTEEQDLKLLLDIIEHGLEDWSGTGREK